MALQVELFRTTLLVYIAYAATLWPLYSTAYGLEIQTMRVKRAIKSLWSEIRIYKTEKHTINNQFVSVKSHMIFFCCSSQKRENNFHRLEGKHLC